MISMATLSLMVGIKTIPFRRAQDQRDLLGYLPPDCNVVAVIHVKPALQELAGRELLTRLRLGPLDVGLDRLEQLTTIQSNEMDTIALGLRLDNRLIPRLTLVLQTDGAVDPRRLQTVLERGAAAQVQRPDRRVYEFHPGHAAIPLYAWDATNHIVIFALAGADFDLVPDYPRSGITHLSSGIREFVKKNVNAQTHVWLAADSDDWARTIVAAPVAKLLDNDPVLIRSLQTCGFALRFGEDVSVDAVAGMQDRSSAEGLRSQLAKTVTRDQKWLAPQLGDRTVSWHFHESAATMFVRLAQLEMAPLNPKLSH
jgi:hypothetical protein